jgi:hypothetical protein
VPVRQNSTKSKFPISSFSAYRRLMVMCEIFKSSRFPPAFRLFRLGSSASLRWCFVNLNFGPNFTPRHGTFPTFACPTQDQIPFELRAP